MVNSTQSYWEIQKDWLPASISACYPSGWPGQLLCQNRAWKWIQTISFIQDSLGIYSLEQLAREEDICCCLRVVRIQLNSTLEAAETAPLVGEATSVRCYNLGQGSSNFGLQLLLDYSSHHHPWPVVLLCRNDESCRPKPAGETQVWETHVLSPLPQFLCSWLPTSSLSGFFPKMAVAN